MKTDLQLLQEANSIALRYEERAEVKDRSLDEHLHKLLHKTITKEEANLWMKAFLEGEIKQLSEYLDQLLHIKNEIVHPDSKSSVDVLYSGILKQKQDKDSDLQFFHEVTMGKYNAI